MVYSDEKIKENIAASKASDIAYTKWYANLPEEKKATMFKAGFDPVARQIEQDVLLENPYSCKATIIKHFVERIHKSKLDEATYAFIERKLQERIEKEWQLRFKNMKTMLNLTYDDIAKFTDASTGASVKASINRKVSAFAKLAVCIFEQLENKDKNTTDKK